MKDRSKINNHNKGSMTVEAALAFPIFFFSILLFLYFLQVLNVQEIIHRGITDLCTEIADYGFILQDLSWDDKKAGDADLEDMIENFGIDQKMLSAADHFFLKYRIGAHLNIDFIESSCVADGFSGLSFLGSSLLDDEGYVDVVCKYQLKFPIPFFSLRKIDVLQRVKIRSFRGLKIDSKFKEAANDENVQLQEKIVYITETGNVYHISPSCTHLRLSIKKIGFDDIPESRNENGAKYDSCKKCVSNANGNHQVYITKSGTSYHYSIGCSGLKRTVKSVNIEELAGWRLCSRCGKLQS